MQIGAILTVPAGRRTDADTTRAGGNYFAKELFGTSARMLIEILGRSVLDRTLDKLRELTTLAPALISESSASRGMLPPKDKKAGFITAWEKAVDQHVRNGADLLLLVRMSAYSEVEHGDLLRFHVDRGAPITQAYDPDSPLDVAVVTVSALRGAAGSYRNSLRKLIPQQQRYSYSGYVNRLRSPQELRRLIEDGLRGQCGLTPAGREIAPQVWCAAGAQVDGSAVIAGPAFIGNGARVSAYCLVTGTTSIERNSEIDCGTTVEDSSVLPDSYVGVGLHVKRSLVVNKRLFHLDRNVEVGFRDASLIGLTGKTSPLLATVRASLGG